MRARRLALLCLPTRSHLCGGLGRRVCRRTARILWGILVRSAFKPSDKKRTIITEQELVFVRPEHTHGPT